MSQNYKPTEGFKPKPIINQHFGRQGHIQPNSRIKKKPVDRNNLGQSEGSWKANQHTFYRCDVEFA